MDNVQKFFSDNPIWGGVLISGFGILLLLASIYDWNWIFGNINPNNFNTSKIDGIVNMFGRKTARVVCGIISIIVIAGGILWIRLYWK